MPYNASEQEKKILAFWKEGKFFERSIKERPKDKPFVFYDGPPFATGLPHYGHIVASCMKDMVPRYKTMQGYRVERVWGWDCHGLPIENIVEKELGTKSKQEVEELGVDKFNELCRSKVLSYVEEWEKTITRLGRWVDMEHAYRTMDKNFMESVWWVFKQLWNKNLLYKGYKPMHICPRCETTLSQQEVSEGYKDVKDISVTARFRVLPESVTHAHLKPYAESLYFLAWTTTPWTLPGNVLLAAGADIEYVVVKLDGDHYILAKDLLMANMEGKEFEVVDHVRGKDLVGITYEPLFPYFADSENSFRVVTADFVTTADGTGLVHLAPAFGTDDYEVFKAENVPFIQHVKMDGHFIDAVTDFAGMHVKPVEDHTKTDVEIVKWLAHNGKLFSKKKYEHSYPHCWRCDTPLLNYATDSWFVNVTELKKTALAEAQKVNWSPEHIKEGRFGKWLEGARDWSISRQRFWASCIPVWECTAKPDTCAPVVIGSVKELEERSGQNVDDLHKHIVDDITFACACGGTMKRVPEVLDTWFDSGSMPYAQVHYPFENKETFEAGFPAEFIAEGQDQTRAWFYYLHVLAVALTGGPAYRNVIVNGIVLAEDGKKMSKKLQNYPDPNMILEKYGADALRYYLMSSPVVAAENLNFSEEGVREVYNKVVNMLSNVLAFYELVAGDSSESVAPSDHVLDKWILARLHTLVQTVTKEMDAYRLHEATRPMMDFIADVSQWYVRRSRDRFKDGDAAGVATLRHVLFVLSKLMAPVTPFLAEVVFQTVKGNGAAESVHLEQWPEADDAWRDSGVVEDMQRVRTVVELGLSARAEAGIRVRQPLQYVRYQAEVLSAAFEAIIADELNVKEVLHTEAVREQDDRVVKEESGVRVGLNTTVTDELKQEGLLRELVRTINGMRKDMGLTREDRVAVQYQTKDAALQAVLARFGEELCAQVLADSVTEAMLDAKPLTLDGHDVTLRIEKT